MIKNRKTGVQLLLGTLLAAFAVMACAADEPTPMRAEAPPPHTAWWKEQKIVFMWGQWPHARVDKSANFLQARLPRELFRNIALAGATVYADTWTAATWTEKDGGWILDTERARRHAAFAHEFGIKYFDTLFVSDLPEAGKKVPNARKAIAKHGEESYYRRPWCPLDEAVYGKWMVEPYLALAREGLLDGLHLDWEFYGGSGEASEAMPCYCDDCFSKFLADKGTKQALPKPAERFSSLEKQGLVRVYEEHYYKRRLEMFTRIRQKLQAANARLMFSSYHHSDPGFMKGMHTPETPHIILDPRHYSNDDRQPWWESKSARFREEGYLYIPGGWTNALFGAQASQVSAARWIYETSLHEDGCWLWFERELDDEILRAYAAASRELKGVQNRVGKFLFQGTRDRNFLTAVEWTGRPELAQAVLTRAYHLGREHLAHISNVDSEWPLRVRIRFPRLEEGKEWTLREPMSGLYYSLDGQLATWTKAQLQAGVVIAMEPRSDLFLQVTPADAELRIPAATLFPSGDFSVLPPHAITDDKTEAEAVGFSRFPDADKAKHLLLYTASESMGFEGVEGGLSLANAIRAVDPQYGIGPRLRQLRGHLWSPSYSPDGKRVVFVHDSGGRGQIFSMRGDGSGAVNLSNNAFCDRSPVWSPDGAKIAFLSDRSGDWDIWVMNADGKDQRRLAGNPGLDRPAVWSPDGKRLAWESHGSGIPTVWVCDSNGANNRPLIPAGKQVEIKQVRDWEAKDPKDGLFNFAESEHPWPKDAWELRCPVWSPDGTQIAAVIDGLGGYSSDVALVSLDGSRVIKLTYSLGCSGNLVWSPDGKQIAGTYRTPAESENSGVFVIHADRSDGQRHGIRLADATPTGPRLGGAKRHGLMTWYSNGSAQPRRVVKTFTSLCWSPEGKTLAFSSDLAPTGAFYIYTVSVDGGGPKRLDVTRSAWPNEIHWMSR